MLALIMPQGSEIAPNMKKISRGQVVTLGLNHPVFTISSYLSRDKIQGKQKGKDSDVGLHD